MVDQANDRQNLVYNDDAMQINDDLGKDGDLPNPTRKSSRRSSKMGDKNGDKGNDADA
jgi:hypothetical protein